VLVVEEKILCLVVGHVDVGIAVAVKVRRGHAHGPAFVSADSGLIRHVGERSIAIVVVETIGIGSVIKRAGIVIGRVVIAVLRIELHIPSHE
jgi:hypothetical protein